MHVVQCDPSKGEMRYPRPDQRSPFKAASATRHPLLPLPLPAHKPYQYQRLPAEREGERAGRTRAEKQPPPSASPAGLGRTASPSPSRDPQFAAGSSPERAAPIVAWGCRFRCQQPPSSLAPAAGAALSPATRLELCCRGGGQGQGARIAGVLLPLGIDHHPLPLRGFWRL